MYKCHGGDHSKWSIFVDFTFFTGYPTCKVATRIKNKVRTVKLYNIYIQYQNLGLNLDSYGISWYHFWQGIASGLWRSQSCLLHDGWEELPATLRISEPPGGKGCWCHLQIAAWGTLLYVAMGELGTSGWPNGCIVRLVKHASGWKNMRATVPRLQHYLSEHETNSWHVIEGTSESSVCRLTASWAQQG